VKIDAEREQLTRTQRDVGGIALGGGGLRRWMTEAAQELAPAGVKVEHAHLRGQAGENFGAVVPGEVVFLGVAAIDVGKIPSLYVRNAFFCLPTSDPFISVHDNHSFFIL
jgi:hypothetical protein